MHRIQLFILVLCFEEVVATAVATAVATTTTTTIIIVAVATIATMFHSRFLSRTEFDQMSTSSKTAATAATAAPMSAICRRQIIRWKSLEIGAVFRVIDRITIPTAPEPKHYVVLQTEQQQIIHVWITDIINQELLKYDLTMGNVFIKPLGKKKSNTSEFEYYDFDIVVDVVNSFNFIQIMFNIL